MQHGEHLVSEEVRRNRVEGISVVKTYSVWATLHRST